MTYVRNAWYVAAWAHEIVAESPTGLLILNQSIVVWRNSAGDLVAFEDRCIHRLAPLSLGRCEGEHLRCMYHGLLFDRTGRVVEIPGQGRIPSSLRIRTYPVVERHGWIWVWMGSAAEADVGLIPPVGMDVDRADSVFGQGRLDYAAEARLICENLLDLSHVSFLHAESFRTTETWARERPKVTQQERSVRIERWFRNEGVNGTRGPGELVDTFLRVDCFIPGVFLFAIRTYPVGTANVLNGHPPDLNQLPRSSVSHAVTPLTDKTARYFYMVGDRRRGTETVYDMTETEKGFAEDKTMIEAQQRNIDGTPGWRFVPTTADRGVILFNRLIEKLTREEFAQASQAPAAAPAHI